MYTEFTDVLANHGKYLNQCKALIKEAKCDMVKMRDPNATKAQHLRSVKAFVVINTFLVYHHFKTLKEAQVIASCPNRMFDDIHRCHVHHT